MSYRVILVWLCLAMVFPLLGSAPAASEPPALTARQQNLLLQLADAEANIQAINRALKVTGYRVGVAYDHIDSNLNGSEIMDRKGGGPVRWDAFYGKTAKDYGTNHWGDQRPQQFDFVYRANDDQISRARDSIANLAKNQEALLERRQKHEADQSRLWATLAWEQVKDREIALHGTSRFALKPSGPDASVLRPVILFLRTADRVAAEGLDSVQNDQVATFQSGSQRMTAAFTALQLALADALEDPGLKTEHRAQGQALKALCKDLSEQCKVIADNYANALDRDKAKQDTSKLEFRGLLQESLARFAMVVGQLDEQVATTTKDWGVGPDRGTPTPDAVPAAPVIAVNMTTPLGGSGNSQSTVQGTEPDAQGFVSLFDGKTLNGWEGLPGFWSVQDGAIVGAETKEHAAPQTFLILKGHTVANFELAFKYKFNTPDGNSGVQFRSRIIDRKIFRVGGYQADMDGKRGYDGTIYDEAGVAGGRSTMSNRGEKTVWDASNRRRNESAALSSESLQAKISANDWNDVLLVAIGNHITYTINGQLMTELIDDSPKALRTGVIALQLHKGFVMEIQFKDIKIKDLK